jgi:type IV fimbrial biogenesis protein FimT
MSNRECRIPGLCRVGRYAAHGFTLIEMMMVITIIGLLVAVGVPMFSDAMLSSRVSSYSNNVLASVYTARSEAMKRNTAVTLCTSANGTTCATTGGWQQGWIVLAPDPEDATATVVLQHQQAIPSGYSVVARNAANALLYTMSFQPTGVGATQATIKVCRESPSAGKQERLVTVSATGKPSVTRTELGVCP